MPASTVYTGRITNWPILCLNLTVALGMMANLWIQEDPWRGLGVFNFMLGSILLALVSTTTSQRVTTGPMGLTVTFGAFGFPRFTTPRDTITAVEIINLDQSAVRDWWALFPTRHGRSLFMRPGPGLRIHRSNGRDLIVSVPDPAAAIQALAITR